MRFNESPKRSPRSQVRPVLPRAAPLLLAALLASAMCDARAARQPPHPVRPAPRPGTDRGTPRSAAKPSPASRPAAPALPLHRRLGHITGSFVPEKYRAVQGEPLFVRMTLTNTAPAPLRYDVGGDYRGTLWQNRLSLLVRDSRGRLLCDLVTNPPMNFGGVSGTRELKPGETAENEVVLNPVCPALTEPGRYKVTLVHVFALDQALPKGCSSHSPPDVTRPDPPVIGSTSKACLSALGTFPALASEFDLEIIPYQQAAVQTAARALAQVERSRIPSAKNWQWYFGWACNRFLCGCTAMTLSNQRGPEDRARWLEETAATMPKTWPRQACSPSRP